MLFQLLICFSKQWCSYDFCLFCNISKEHHYQKTHPHLIKYLTLQSNSTFEMFPMSKNYCFQTCLPLQNVFQKYSWNKLHEWSLMKSTKLDFKISSQKMKWNHTCRWNWWCKWILHVNESISMKSITLTTYMP